MNFGDLRKEYRARALERKMLLEDPLPQFLLWLQEANQVQIIEPTAMVLATATRTGQVSSRTVLLKHADEDGFIFFTNYGSKKAQDIAENPQASVTFLWKELERQVNIQGHIKKTSHETSQAYFSKRPRQSQLGSAASRQSREISSRQVLEEEYLRLEELFKGREIPLPEEWGGFILEPTSYEFWQGRENRLHDRFIYKKESEGKWKISRLAP